MSTIKHTMKVLIKVAIGNKFINQHLSSSRNAIPNKWNKVAMMNTANNLNLSLKLSLSLSATRFETLDRDLFPIW